MVRVENRFVVKNNLSKLLKEHGMTGEELAKRIDVTPPTISRFKKSKTVLSMDKIVKLTKVLNITIGELFGEVPVDYRDVMNIKYVENINQFSNSEELNDEKNYTLYGMSTSLLVRMGIKKPTGILMTKISNNSMYDTVSPTDNLLIETKDVDIDRDGLYLIEEQGRLEVRRITIMNDINSITTKVDNPKHIGYTGRNYTRKEVGDIVCGRVLKVVKNDV
jgi:transcriptional regulator with XRE-family HTH domain